MITGWRAWVVVAVFVTGIAALCANQLIRGPTMMERQIDEFSSATLAWVRTQNVVGDGNCGTQMGVEYDVFFIWYEREIAVLTSKGKGGEIEYTICHNVWPRVLEEWSLKRHFRG